MDELIQILLKQKEEKDRKDKELSLIPLEENKVYYNSDKYVEVHPCHICGSRSISTRCIVVKSEQYSLWCCFNCAEEKYPNNYQPLYGIISPKNKT